MEPKYGQQIIIHAAQEEKAGIEKAQAAVPELAIHFEVRREHCVALLMAAHFLEIPSLVSLCARMLAHYFSGKF